MTQVAPRYAAACSHNRFCIAVHCALALSSERRVTKWSHQARSVEQAEYQGGALTEEPLPSSRVHFKVGQASFCLAAWQAACLYIFVFTLCFPFHFVRIRMSLYAFL